MQGVVKSSNTSKLISAMALTKLGLTHVPQRYVLPSSQRPNLHHIIVHSSTSLPIIDLSNLQNPSLRSHTLDEIQMACKEVGFFQVHACSCLPCTHTHTHTHIYIYIYHLLTLFI